MLQRLVSQLDVAVFICWDQAIIFAPMLNAGALTLKEVAFQVLLMTLYASWQSSLRWQQNLLSVSVRSQTGITFVNSAQYA